MLTRTILIFALLIVTNCELFAQLKNSLFISTSNSFTYRNLDFSNNTFSKQEIDEIRKLESVKPSFKFQFGLFTQKNKNLFFQFGLGYRHTRFGTKIYTVPDSISTITPQYGKEKKVILQSQSLTFFEFGKKISDKNYLSFKISLIYNNLYKIYSASFDDHGRKAFSGILEADRFLSHRFDLNVEIGHPFFIQTKNNRILVVKPFASLFIKKYTIDDTYNSYLYYFKDTVGYVWDIGITLQYNLLKNTI